ncbi:MAG: hypothetical protein ACUVTQ_01575 [Desulfotomaculales bacterium]
MLYYVFLLVLVAIASYHLYRRGSRRLGLSARGAWSTAGLGALVALLGPWAAAWLGYGGALALAGLSLVGGGLVVAWSERRYGHAGGEVPVEGTEEGAVLVAEGTATVAETAMVTCEEVAVPVSSRGGNGTGAGWPATAETVIETRSSGEVGGPHDEILPAPSPGDPGVGAGSEAESAAQPAEVEDQAVLVAVPAEAVVPEAGAGAPVAGAEPSVGRTAGRDVSGSTATAVEAGLPDAAGDGATVVPEPGAGETVPPPPEKREMTVGPPGPDAGNGVAALLEQSYGALAAGEIEWACAGFRRALEEGLSPSLAVLVAGNAAALYRSSGEYREAVRILRRVRLLYGARLSRKETGYLEAQITYLETLRWLLEREGLAGLPWHAVPAALKERAARAARYTS